MFRSLVALSIVVILAAPLTAAVPSAERAALIALHASTNGAGWTNSSGWLGASGTECTWHGVTCASDSVVAIELPENNLTGGLPPEIGDFTSLERLDLGSNALTGAIPPEIGELTRLEVLRLESNQLSGAFPLWITAMTSLRELNLRTNGLSGSIPADIGNLVNLEYLDLLGNQLTGSIPPGIGNLTKLRELWMHFNQLSGSLPSEIGNLTALEWLDLEANELDGTIPDSIGNLTRLVFLDIGRNQFTGPVPATIVNLRALVSLDIGECRLTGGLPEFLGTMTNLRSISLGANNLGGEIPANLGNLANLESLWINDNGHTGSIPESLAALVNLRSINLSRNRLTGGIPSGFANATKLRDFLLFGNELSGPLPYFGDMPDMVNVTLWGNQLSGPFPAEIASLPKLRFFDIGGNRLVTGELPSDLGNLTQLEAFVIGLNQVSGPIPPSIGQLTKLIELHMGSNLLSGTIPGAIGNLPLTGLSLGRNQFRGEVPIAFLNLTETTYLNLTDNALTASDPNLSAFLEAKFPFISYQTIAPVDVRVAQAGSTAVTLNWTPIPYAYGPGGYQVLGSTTQSGPYSPLLTTASKEIGSATVTGLQPTTTYFFVLKAITFPFGDQLNTIFSDESAEVTATTTAFVASPAEVIVAAYPGGIAQSPNVGGGTDSFTLTNIGGTTAQIALTQDGDFFAQSPASFSLAPGAIQAVSLTGLAKPEGWYGARSLVWVDAGETPALEVWVQLFAAQSSATAAVIQSTSNRLDVAGPEGVNPIGEVRFRNDGSERFTGVLVPDVDFLVPQQGLVTIEPGATFTGTVSADRAKRPDASLLAGSQSGTVSLRSVPTFAKGSKTVFSGTTVTSSLVTVVDTVTPPTQSSVPAPLRPGEIALFIPRVGRSLQGVGQFLSDVSITHGRGAALVSDLKLIYTPSSTSATSTVATLKPLAASQMVAFNDVVKSVFSQTDGFGTLQIRTKDTPSLSVAASLFVADDPRGNFGTAIPTLRSDRSATTARPTILAGLRNDAAIKTTLYVQETTGNATTATIEWRNAQGTKVGTTDLPLAAFGFSDALQVPAGASTARVTAGDGSVVAWATQADSGSGDLWELADWSQAMGYEPGEPVIIPIALARTEETGGGDASPGNARRRPIRRIDGPGPRVVTRGTDLTITNRCEKVVDPAEVPSTPCAKPVASGVLRYRASDGQTLETQIELGLLASVTFDDVVRTTFGVTSNSEGYLEFVPENGIFAVTSRTFTRGSATFATGVPAVGRSLALRPGQSRRLGGLSDSTSATIEDAIPGTTRTAFGLIEVSGQPASVDVSVFINDPRALVAGSAIGKKRYELAPGEAVRAESMVEAIIGDRRNNEYGDLRNVQVRFDVVGTSGTVLVYTMSVDNGTGDAVLRTE